MTFREELALFSCVNRGVETNPGGFDTSIAVDW